MPYYYLTSLIILIFLYATLSLYYRFSFDYRIKSYRILTSSDGARLTILSFLIVILYLSYRIIFQDPEDVTSDAQVADISITVTGATEERPEMLTDVVYLTLIVKDGEVLNINDLVMLMCSEGGE